MAIHVSKGYWAGLNVVINYKAVILVSNYFSFLYFKVQYNFVTTLSN